MKVIGLIRRLGVVLDVADVAGRIRMRIERLIGDSDSRATAKECGSPTRYAHHELPGSHERYSISGMKAQKARAILRLDYNESLTRTDPHFVDMNPMHFNRSSPI